MPDNLQAFEIDYKDVEKKYDKFNKDIADAFGADSVEAFKKTGDLDFEQLISKFKIAGVDFIEVNQIRKFAIAKHENYIQYPERRYAIVQDEKGKVKFYEINYTTGDFDHAEEINQAEFENFGIPTYLKDNDVTKKMLGDDALPRELKDYLSKDREKQKFEYDGNNKEFKKIKKSETDDKSDKHADDVIKAPETKLYEGNAKIMIDKIFEDDGYTGSVGNEGQPSDLAEQPTRERVLEIPEEVLDFAEMLKDQAELPSETIARIIAKDSKFKNWFQTKYNGTEHDLMMELEEILDSEIDESHPGNDQLTDYVTDNALETGAKNPDGSPAVQIKYQGKTITGKDKQDLYNQISGNVPVPK